MGIDLDKKFEEAWLAAMSLVAEKKWNAEKVYVLNKFGEPIINAFVPDEDAFHLANYELARYKGFRVVFSRLRAWNPLYENDRPSG
jgi:hypothetical protein